VRNEGFIVVGELVEFYMANHYPDGVFAVLYCNDAKDDRRLCEYFNISHLPQNGIAVKEIDVNEAVRLINDKDFAEHGFIEVYEDGEPAFDNCTYGEVE